MNAIYQYLRRAPELLLLVVGAFLTRFWSLARPNAVVFDEVYFKEFASHYLDGKYYFDIHPPLAKLLFAGWARIFGLSASALTTQTATTLRILPALAGALLVPIIYLIARQFNLSRATATLAALLVLLDNALLVESRFILTDSLLLTASFASVLCFLYFRRKYTQSISWAWLVAAALLSGVAISIKWTALANYALILMAWAIDYWRGGRPNHARRMVQAAVLLILPILVYLCTFWVHLNLLPKSGPGDAFMTKSFQATLVGNENFTSSNSRSFMSKFIELNNEMYKASATLKATHPYGSSWYSWPLELRPIYYYQGSAQSDGRQANIYLLGNPFIWWGVVAAIALALARVNSSWAQDLRPVRYPLLLIAAGYAFNYLPFIAVSRVMFLYHYFFAFIWSILFALCLYTSRAGWASNIGFLTSASRKSRLMYWGIGIAVAAMFIYMAPLSYGWQLTPNQLQYRQWLPSWK